MIMRRSGIVGVIALSVGFVACAPPPNDEAPAGEAEEAHVVMEPGPRPFAELPPAVEPPPPPTDENVGTTSQALATSSSIASSTLFANHTLYVADGSGGSWLGAYPVTASIYWRFNGRKYWVQGPGTWLEQSQEILSNLANRMYWDCASGYREATIAGYSRGAYYTLEALRWAQYWGCAPTVRAALFVDPVDTSIWSFNHTVPWTAQVRLVRKSWFFNAWATVFANGPIYGGTQFVRDVPATHPDLGVSTMIAEDEISYGRWFIGYGAFR